MMIPGENALVPGKSIEKCEASWEVLPWGGPSGVTRCVCMMGSFTGFAMIIIHLFILHF